MLKSIPKGLSLSYIVDVAVTPPYSLPFFTLYFINIGSIKLRIKINNKKINNKKINIIIITSKFIYIVTFYNSFKICLFDKLILFVIHYHH